MNMKTKSFCFILFFLFFTFFFFSCKKTESNNHANYPSKISFEEYSLEGTQCQWKNVPFNDKVVVINNEEELEKYLSCSEDTYPSIDFNRHALLLASGKCSSGVLNLFVKGLQQHSLTKFSLDIEITLNDTAFHNSWFKALIINKLSENGKVKLNTTIKEQEIVYPVEVPFLEYSIEGTQSKWKKFYGYLGNNDIVIINSNEKLERYLECDSAMSYPEIDFSKYSLLLALGVHGEMKKEKVKTLKKLSRQNYLMQIFFDPSETQDIKYWWVPIMVKKIDEESMVELKVVIYN